MLGLGLVRGEEWGGGRGGLHHTIKAEWQPDPALVEHAPKGNLP